jgi:hypothetical protein
MVINYKCYEGSYCLHLHDSASNSSYAILKEAATSSETSANNYKSTRLNNPEYCNINGHRRDNATSHTHLLIILYSYEDSVLI